MKLLSNALVTDLYTGNQLRKTMIYAQVFQNYGNNSYEVGLMIENVEGEAYILQPNLAVRIDEELFEKLKDVRIEDANINLFALWGVYK